MSKQELKERLFSKISRIENELLLKDILNHIEIEEEVGIYQLTPDDIAAVEEGQADFKAGKFFTQEESDKDVEEWLGK